jgi:hypothetical protein
MQRQRLIIILLILATLCAHGAAQRMLDAREVADVLRVLTREPVTTWISSGVMRARHLEYRAETDQIIESDVTVRCDGDRFYWEINIDSSHGGQDAKQRPLPGAIDVQQNRDRIYVWDGSKYTIYFKSGNQVIVYEDASRLPVTVNGPLTAGLIPWGVGAFTYDALSGGHVSAIETQRGGRTVVELMVQPNDTLRMDFVLDRQKDYAVLAGTVRSVGRSILVRTCDGHRLIGGRWLPSTVDVELYDDSQTPAQLISFDHWDFQSVSTDRPAASAFRVPLEAGVRIEEYTRLSDKPLTWYTRPQADTEMLRQKRLEIVAAGGAQSSNCAIVAARYVLSRAGKQMTQQQKTLLAGSGSGPSLHDVKAVLTGAGLNCRAVRTDLDGLRKVKDCSVILHLPNRKHFVILDHIEQQRVWLIDLDHDRFYFPMDLDQLHLEWLDGTALLVSQKALTEAEALPVIGDTQLKKMIGADSFGTYSCNQLIQDHHVVYCFPVPEAACGGQYRQYFARWACGLDHAGGTCTSQGLASFIGYNCLENPYYPGRCSAGGEPIVHMIHACD